MAVTLTHTPGRLSFSRNPMVFEFASDRYLSDVGSVFLGYLYFFNDSAADFVGPTEDSVLLLSMYNTTQVFTFKADGKGDNNELPIKGNGEAVNDWIDRVILSLKKNYIINTYYQVQYTPGIEVNGDVYMALGDAQHYIEFRSIERNSLANMVLSNESVSLAGQAISTFARNISYEVNLRIYVELWARTNTSDFSKLIGTSLPTDKEGRAKWDVSIPLNDFLQLYRQTFTTLSTLQNTDDQAMYYLRFTEIFGPALSTGDYHQSEVKRALYGGQRKADFENGGVELLYKNDVSSWLTHLRSGEAELLQDQSQWLSWVNLSDQQENYIIKARVSYENGTYWIHTLYTGVINPCEKISFPINLEALDRDGLFVGQKIVDFSVFVESDLKRLSPEIQFKVNYQYLPFASVFAYRNSYGAYETLYTSGEKGYSYEIEKNSAEILSVHTSLARSIDFGIELHDKIKINTGYKSKGDLQIFRDFFLSDEKYMLVDGIWTPILLDTSSIDEYSDGNILYGFSFDIKMQERTNLWGR